MIITRTPYRVSLAGGGTDFPEYFREQGTLVINMAVNKHLYVLLTPRLDSLTRLAYFRGAELVHEVDELEHDIVRAVLQRYEIRGGVEIATIGEIPAGTGLGSSSVVSVGLVHAVRAYLGLKSSPRMLAEEAIRIERELLSRPTGWQDAWGVAFPGLKALSFGPGTAARAEPLALSAARKQELARNSLLVFTQQDRPADVLLAEQHERIGDNRSALDDILGLARSMRASLEADDGGIDYPSLGAMLSENWEAKRTLASGIDNVRIAELYDIGMASGAWGGKLLGAGGGGFLFFLAPEERQPHMIARMGNPVTLPLEFDETGTSVVYSTQKKGGGGGGSKTGLDPRRGVAGKPAANASVERAGTHFRRN